MRATTASRKSRAPASSASVRKKNNLSSWRVRVSNVGDAETVKFAKNRDPVCGSHPVLVTLEPNRLVCVANDALKCQAGTTEFLEAVLGK